MPAAGSGLLQAQDFDFAFNTAAIGTGANTGIVIPAGAFIPTTDGAHVFARTALGAAPAGNAGMILGSSASLVTSAAVLGPGALGVIATSATAFPWAVPTTPIAPAGFSTSGLAGLHFPTPVTLFVAFVDNNDYTAALFTSGTGRLRIYWTAKP